MYCFYKLRYWLEEENLRKYICQKRYWNKLKKNYIAIMVLINAFYWDIVGGKKNNMHNKKNSSCSCKPKSFKVMVNNPNIYLFKKFEFKNSK